jgi:[glutamine synthetase] adenylyltransferase / [glutamine synthetase]-adenylyl-L-tyrosine phosphorylase
MANHLPQLPPSLEMDARQKWQAFVAAAMQSGSKWPLHPGVEHSAEAVFALSNYVATNCLREPAMLCELIESGDLLRIYPPNAYPVILSALPGPGTTDFSGANPPNSADACQQLLVAEFEQRLRRLRQREMIRIAWRDLAGWADLNQTMTDLSAFAEACIDRAVACLYAHLTSRYGYPREANGTLQQLVVVGMGKLGACELNFSSDVDLIFAFPDSGQTDHDQRPISNDDFFLRLCRQLVGVLSRNSADGFVFRVDTRLRPYGDGGPLVMSFDHLETYYQAQGREWERYALIKARVVAGDRRAGAGLLNRLKPFVYRRYLDFGVFESLREMKTKISLEVARQGSQTNIKLGAGGIREIEFFVQIFQLIRGGIQPALQEPRILPALELLAAERLVPEDVCRALTRAYEFLRRTEHRLQEYEDRQTHVLPLDAIGRLRLAVAMGFADWPAFAEELTQHMTTVHRHFNSLLAGPETEANKNGQDGAIHDLEMVWQQSLGEAEGRRALSAAGFDQPGAVLKLMEDLRNDSRTRSLSSTGRQRLNRLMPWILRAVGKTDQPTQVANRIFDLLKSIQRRTSYLALLLTYPTALSHLVRLSAASSWIVSFLGQHPVLLDELLDSRTLYAPPGKQELAKELRQRLAQIPEDDIEYQMEVLRIFKQVQTLRVAASDITDALPLMKVSDHLSDIAETILDQVVDLSWRYLLRKHGRPECRLNGQTIDQGFAVVAYGKLGGLELGYGSDVDLVFLHAACPGETQGGPRPIDNGQFFARLGQRVVHILTAHTTTGILYETDMRLRPSGSSGPLVCHVDGFKDYQLNQAWTWEHQALIRARAIAGCEPLKQRFESIRREALGRRRQPLQLRAEVSGMRQKMRKLHSSPEAGDFDLKQDPGGIVDIEFLVQYLVLLKSCRSPSILQWTDNVRLLQSLFETGIIGHATAYRLRRAYLIYRAIVHRLDLQEKPACLKDDRLADLRQWVQRIWIQVLG